MFLDERDRPAPGPGAQRTDRHDRAPGWLALVGYVGVAELAGLVGIPFTDTGTGSWYDSLDKPWFTPPGAVFGPTWTVLYAAVGTAAWTAWRHRPSRRRSTALRWWGAHLIANAAWTPIFFGAQRPGWALAHLLVVDATAVGTVIRLRRVDRVAARLFAPYLAWLGFATALNLGIVLLNRGTA